jgi:hypothetical protein
MTAVINNIILLAANIWMASYHAKLIAQHRPIKHGWWTAAYLGLVGLLCMLFTWWWLPVGIFLRAVVFNPALNLFRGLAITYISKSTTSIIDKLEYRLFGKNWNLRMVWYFSLLVVFEILLIVLT